MSTDRPSNQNRAITNAWAQNWGESDFDALTGGPRTKDESASDFLSSLFRDGVFSPIKDPLIPYDPNRINWEGREIPNPRIIQALEGKKLLPRAQFQIDLDQMYLTPEVLRYQENAHNVMSPGLPDGFLYLPYELARFITPQESIGVVRTVETDIEWEDPLIRWPRGDAMFHTREGVLCHWYLRLESYDPSNPPNPYAYRDPVFPPNELPGVPFPPLPEWDEMRFLWGGYNPVYFILPPASILSLWIGFYSKSCNTPLRSVTGRLTGFTQAQSNMRAYQNVTMSW